MRNAIWIEFSDRENEGMRAEATQKQGMSAATPPFSPFIFCCWFQWGERVGGRTRVNRSNAHPLGFRTGQKWKLQPDPMLTSWWAHRVHGTWRPPGRSWQAGNLRELIGIQDPMEESMLLPCMLSSTLFSTLLKGVLLHSPCSQPSPCCYTYHVGCRSW